MNTILPQGIGAVSLISGGMAPIPYREIVFMMDTRPDEIDYTAIFHKFVPSHA